jgi:hypothetical protein
VQLGSSHGSLQSAAATRQQGDVDPEIVHSDAASKAAPACRRCDDVDDGDLDGEQMHMWGLDEKPGKVEVDEWQVSQQGGNWPTFERNTPIQRPHTCSVSVWGVGSGHPLTHVAIPRVSFRCGTV